MGERIGDLFGKARAAVSPAPAAQPVAQAASSPFKAYQQWAMKNPTNLMYAGAGTIGLGGAGYLGLKHMQAQRAAGY